MRVRRGAFVIAAMLLAAAAFAPAKSTHTSRARSEVPSEEYAVYNALLGLMEFPRKDPHVLISSRTLNLRCGKDTGNPILMNGCGGMRIPQDKPQDIHRLLRDHWPAMAITTWEDFAEKNGESAALHDAFLAPWKHRLFGEELPNSESKEWSSPDAVIYFSRIGFNGEKNEAILFVLNLSYMEEIPTSGNYFLFRLKGKKWGPEGRVRYMELDKSESE